MSFRLTLPVTIAALVFATPLLAQNAQTPKPAKPETVKTQSQPMPDHGAIPIGSSGCPAGKQVNS